MNLQMEMGPFPSVELARTEGHDRGTRTEAHTRTEENSDQGGN